MSFLTTKMRGLALAIATLTAVVGTGCNNKAEPKGQATVAVGFGQAAAVIADVSKVELNISGGTPAMTPIVTTLTKAPSGNQWTGNITGIPAGTGRVFKATATKADGTKLYEGTASSDIVAGSTATVVIILQEQNVPPGPTNFAPVISGVSASSPTIKAGKTATFTFSASDPDSNYPLAYEWSTSCKIVATGAPAASNGTFSTTSGSLAAATTGTSTIWTAPGTNGLLCTIGIKVTDSNTTQGAASVQAFLTIEVKDDTGSANVAAFPNSFPIITLYRSAIDYNYDVNATTPVNGVGQRGQVFTSAIDPDGDQIRYDYRVVCNPGSLPPAPGQTDDTASLQFATLTAAGGPPGSNPTWFNADASRSCVFTVTIHDLCTNNNCGGDLPAGTPGRLPNGSDRGGVTVGVINATAPAKPARAPFIIRTVAPNVNASGQTVVAPGTAYNLQVDASDPEGGNLSTTWVTNGGTLASVAGVKTGNISSANVWTSPTPLTVGLAVTVTVTSDKSGLQTAYQFQFVGTDPCIGATNGTACDDGNACTTGTTCSNGTCGGGTSVVCPGADQCNNATCNPISGCSVAPKTGASCSDGNACTTGDTCSSAGVCTPGAPVVCTALGQCFNVGVCNPATGTCSAPPKAAGAGCSDGNLCTQTDACDGAGVCVGSNPVNCTGGQCTTGGTCNPATGTCQGGNNQPNGTPCNDSLACTTGDNCQGGVCVGPTPACAVGQTCSEPGTGQTGPQCKDAVITPFAAKSAPFANLTGLALASDGSSYANGVLVGGPKPFSPTVSLTSAGAGDVGLAKYDGAGALVWARNYGDASDQQAAGVTATSTVVATIGQFSGALGTLNNAGAYPIDFVLGINPSNGNISWNKSYDLGLGGNFASVAANPTLGLIAACGKTVIAATTLVPGATFAGGTSDIVIALFDSTGALQWSKQIGSANGEECNAVGIDNLGNVVAAGKYNGGAPAVGFTGTALPAPGTSFRNHLWVATFNGTTGNAISQRSFGGGNGSHQVNGIAFDAAGNIVIAGLFTSTLPFPTTQPATSTTACAAGTNGCLASGGASDAFVAKLNSALEPLWATRIGGTTADEGRGVGVDSNGNVSFAGVINGATTTATVTPSSFSATATALTAPGSSLSAAFVAKLSGATGAFASTTAAVYGNLTNTVNANALSVNRQGVGPVKDLTVFGGEYNGTLNFGGTAGSISTTTGGNEDFIVVSRLQ